MSFLFILALLFAPHPTRRKWRHPVHITCHAAGQVLTYTLDSQGGRRGDSA